MANRYANIPGASKINQSYNLITEGFDKVEQEMDAKPDASIAQVNDIAFDADDTLTIEGGTGIAVTTNPNNKKVTITATGTSTPGAHGSSHTEFGADPIPNATTTEGGLMSAADKTRLDGATSTATPNTLVQRDSAGRFKAAAPAAADDVARKAEVDEKVSKSGDEMRGNLTFMSQNGLRYSYMGDTPQSFRLIDFPDVSTSAVEVMYFRGTNTSGDKRVTFFAGNGTNTAVFRLTNGIIDVLNGLPVRITAYAGNPNGNVAAPPGSICLNTSGGAGSSIYVKESGSGNTGWVAK